MARAKPSMTLTKPQEVDAALAELATLTRDITIAEAAMNEAIDKAKADCKATIEPLAARIKELEGQLAGYGLFNKAEQFTHKRSLDLPHGVIGFRQSTALAAIKGLKLGDVLAKLEQLAADGELTEEERALYARGIRRKAELARDELLTWPDNRLAAVGACRDVRDTFFYELKTETVQTAA